MAKNIAASRQKKPGGLSDKVSDIVLVVICAAVMLIVAYPLYYVLVASFSDPYDVYAGKTFLLPSQFTLKGYQAVFADSALFSGFMNSIKYTVIGTIYSVVMIYLVAYPLSVKDLPGRKYISLFFVITMYFGGGLVPTYLIVKQTGLLAVCGHCSCPVSWRSAMSSSSATSLKTTFPGSCWRPPRSMVPPSGPSL